MPQIKRRWLKSMFRGTLPNWWWAIITLRPLCYLSVSTCSSSLALLSLKLLSVNSLTAALCFQALYVSLSVHISAFGQAAIGQGCFPAITSTCVTTGGLICSGDVSLAELLINRHGVTSPLSLSLSFSLSLSVSFSLFHLPCLSHWLNEIGAGRQKMNITRSRSFGGD